MDFRAPATASRYSRPRRVGRSLAAAATQARAVQTFQALSFADGVTAARQALRAESFAAGITGARRRIVAPSYADGITAATPGTGVPVYTTGYAQRRLVVAPAVTGGATLASFPLPVVQPADLSLSNGARAVANDGTLLATDVAAARAAYMLLPSWNRALRTRWYVHHARPSAAEASSAATVWSAQAALVRCGAAPVEVSARRTASAIGDPTTTTIGEWPAAQFDGVDAVIRLAAIAGIASGALTVACLVQAAAASPTAGLWCFGVDPAAAGARIGLRCQAGKLLMRMETPSGVVSVQTTAVVIGDTQPHHVAVTWIGGTKPLIYVDGVARATSDVNIAGLAGTTGSFAGDLWIGTGLDPATNGRWAGRIGELSVAAVAQSAAWVAAMAAGYLTGSALLGIGADDSAAASAADAAAVAVPLSGASLPSAALTFNLATAIENPAGGTLTYALVGTPSQGSATITAGQLRISRGATDAATITGRYQVTTAGGKTSTSTYTVTNAALDSAWWAAADVRASVANRTFRSGPMNFNAQADDWETNIALVDLVSEDVVGSSGAGGAYKYSWDQISGGPLVAGEPSAITSLADAVKQAKWSAASMGAGLTPFAAASKGKFWIIPIMYGYPTTSEYQDGGRIKASFLQEIANGTHNQRYRNLGKRMRLNMEAYGWTGDALKLCIIRWNKEGDRDEPYCLPDNINTAAGLDLWLDAWEQIVTSVNYGYSNGLLDVVPRHFYGFSRNGNSYTNLSDPRTAYRAGVWDAMEISMHPGIEMTTAVGGVNANDTDAVKMTKYFANWSKFIDGTLNSGTRKYDEMAVFCKTNKLPFIISECDPSHGAGKNVCWVPDWAGKWMFDQFNTWQSYLAPDSCFMHGMFDEANFQTLTKSTDAATETAVKNTWNGTGGDNYTGIKTAGCDNRKIPFWYPGYTTTTPIPAANMTAICKEYARRFDLWTRRTLVGGSYGVFKQYWGT